MTREHRANWIFLGLFLALSLPGAVIMFRKKLDPRASSAILPEPAREQVPYMLPFETPPGMRRFVPEATGAWLGTLAERDMAAGSVDRAAAASLIDRAPLTSDDHQAQLLRWDASGGVTWARLLLWNAGADDAATVSVTAETTEGQTLAGRAIGESVQDIPGEVRKELIRAGYAKPPQRVRRIDAEFPGNLPLGSLRSLKLTPLAAPGRAKQSQQSIIRISGER